jgi:sensor domain CHASE-containing protein/HPt (histidine-containing phosphotransfer) domain-containing protein
MCASQAWDESGLCRDSVPWASGISAMNPFPASPTGSKPSRLERFAARPAPIVFLLCLVLGLAAVAWRAKEGADAARTHARNAAQACGTAVELQLNQAVTAAEVMGALARQGSLGISNFQKVALELLASRPGLASLELQPGGVVNDIVPRAGNERAIGLNVLKDEGQRPGAYAAIQRRVLTATGPLTLYHGEPGIVVRVPIFQRGRDGRDYFWGFLAVSMRLPEALARAGISELSTQGYNYVFFAPASAQQKAVTIAAHGALSIQDAVRQPVRAQNLEFRLALRPRSGWVNATQVALESLGVLVVSSLLCLLANLLQSRRQDSGVAERRQTQRDCSVVKDGTAGAQHEFTLVEWQARLEETRRRANETNEIAQTKLKQAELSVRELQTRLDATSRVAAETTQTKQAELDQANLALAQAHQAIGELQARLEAAAGAENRTAAATKARLQQDQSIIADLQARLDAANRSAREAAEANAATLKQMEASNRELKGSLLVAEKAEIRVTELSDLLQKAEAELKRLRNDSAGSAGVRTAVPVGQVPSEPKEIGGGESVMSAVGPSEASSPAKATLAAPVEQSSATAAGEKLSPVPSENRREHLAVTPTPSAVLPTTTNSHAESPAYPMSGEALANPTAVTALPPAKKKSARIAKREKVRRNEQIDLFEGQIEAAQTPANPAADARAMVSAEDSGLRAPEAEPTSAASPPKELEESAGLLTKQVPVPPKTSERTAPQPQPESEAVSDGLENHSATAADFLDIPIIEGLATADGLARAGGDFKLYFKALQHFVEQQAGAPEKIREALLQGDLAWAERMVQSFKTSADGIGAAAAQNAATALVRAIHEQADPGEIESRWEKLEKVVRDLVADLKLALKPNEAKPAPTRRLPPPPPVNPAHLRKAMNEILPLLADKDPGAKDCLKANRATFRSAFSSEAYEEFEQFVKRGDLGAALEQLKRAAKKHGISL